MARRPPAASWDDGWNDSHRGWDPPDAGWGGGDGWGAPARRAFPWRVIVIVLLVAGGAVVGLRLLGGALEGPAAAARRYLQAAVAYDGNELARRTCAAQQQALMEAGLMITALDMLANYYVDGGLEDIDFDLRDLEFTVVSRTGDQAVVRVSGELRTSLLFLSVPGQVDDSWLMVREDGRWKYCGYPQ